LTDKPQSDSYSDILKSLQEMGVDTKTVSAEGTVAIDATKFHVELQNGQYVVKPKEEEDPTKPPEEDDKKPKMPEGLEERLKKMEELSNKQMEVLSALTAKMSEQNGAISALKNGTNDGAPPANPATPPAPQPAIPPASPATPLTPDGEGSSDPPAQAKPPVSQEAGQQPPAQAGAGEGDHENFTEGWVPGAGAAALIYGRANGVKF